MARRTSPTVAKDAEIGNDAETPKQAQGAAVTTVQMIQPADWDAFDNVTEDGLLVLSTDNGGLAVVTADDPDGTGYTYRTWFIPSTVNELPSADVREVITEDQPVDMLGALRVVVEAYDAMASYSPEGA